MSCAAALANAGLNTYHPQVTTIRTRPLAEISPGRSDPPHAIANPLLRKLLEGPGVVDSVHSHRPDRKLTNIAAEPSARHSHQTQKFRDGDSTEQTCVILFIYPDVSARFDLLLHSLAPELAPPVVVSTQDMKTVRGMASMESSPPRPPPPPLKPQPPSPDLHPFSEEVKIQLLHHNLKHTQYGIPILSTELPRMGSIGGTSRLPSLAANELHKPQLTSLFPPSFSSNSVLPLSPTSNPNPHVRLFFHISYHPRQIRTLELDTDAA